MDDDDERQGLGLCRGKGRPHQFSDVHLVLQDDVDEGRGLEERRKKKAHPPYPIPMTP